MVKLTNECEYAKQIATNLCEKYYKDESLKWEPLDTLMGILSQIDNMIVGLPITYSTRKKKRLLWEIRRYLRHPLCLFGHKMSPNEIGTDGKYFDYYCSRCQKRIKRVPVEESVDFLRFKKRCEEEGIDLPERGNRS